MGLPTMLAARQDLGFALGRRILASTAGLSLQSSQTAAHQLMELMWLECQATQPADARAQWSNVSPGRVTLQTLRTDRTCDCYTSCRHGSHPRSRCSCASPRIASLTFRAKDP